MLLTILNLPYTVTYNDLKSLVYSKCGISDCILDNLTAHENRTKKVTIGLSGEEDAAIFMRKINGSMMNGHKLQVIQKTKNPMSSNMNQGPSQAGPSGSMQPFGPQGSSWGPQLNLKPPPGMLNQGVPTMVPPPGPMEPYGGANNVFYPNQHAYYMMNQPTYSTPPSGPNIGYQTLPFGNMGNQAWSQNSGSNNNWNQQQRSGGPQQRSGGSQSNKDRAGKWDNGGSRWDNSGSRWDNSGSTWDNNESNWDNDDNNDSNWGNNREPERNNSRESRWNNNREPERDNSRESRWNNNSSNWDDNRGPRSNNSNDSKWQSNRVSNHDSYSPNRSAGPSRDQNVSYQRSDRNNSPRSSQNNNRSHTRYSSRDRYSQGDNEPQQNRYKSERQRSPPNRDRYRSPPQNRPRNTKPDFVHGGPAGSKGKRVPTESQVKLCRMWRGKFVFTKANQILSDPLFEYNAPDPAKLLKALQANVRKRLNMIIIDDYPMRIEQLDKEYSKVYGYKHNWEALRDSLQKIGGQMLSKMETGPVTMQPLFKKNKKNKNKNQGPTIPPIPQGPVQFGMFGNLKVDHRFENKDSPAGPSRGNQKLWPENMKGNPKGIPLAMIPGRIPQYPWGDKMLYKRQKREQNEMMAGDLSGRLFDLMNPVVKKAIEDEVESLCANMLEVCDNPKEDPQVGLFINSLKAGVPPELKRALRLNTARRMLPVLPIKIRVHATPVVKREPLEQFLKEYNVSTLLKSVKQPYFVADVNTIAEHDKLCTMEAVKIGNSTVHFKPFHMFDTQKQGKRVAERRTQRAKELAEMNENLGQPIGGQPKGGKPKGGQPKEGQPKAGQPKGSQPKAVQPKKEVDNNISCDDQAVDENACYDVVKDENLCKKMKDIYVKINNKKQNLDLKGENEEYYENEEAAEEFYLSGKQFTDNQDFSNDVDVDYVLDSPKGGKYKREYADNDNELDEKQIAETIEMEDVHADDLVDW